MKILLVSATEAELEPFETIWFRKNQVDRLVSGARELQSKSYDLAINIGLAGSFDRTFKLGEVVRVVEDIFSELGAEDGENILSLKEMGLSGTDILLNLDETMNPHVNKFRKVRGITVNTVHGNEQSIETIQKRLHPQVETMEGAAFFYVCGKEGVSSLQLRAISNYVEKRNREAWDIPLALANLKTAVTDLLNIL